MADIISREKAIETIQYRVCQGHGNKEHICKRGSCAYCGIMEIMNDIENIEAADVQPVKRGKWLNHHAIWVEQPEIEGWFVQAECSECGRWAHVMKPYTKYVDYENCPNCGADMRDS